MTRTVPDITSDLQHALHLVTMYTEELLAQPVLPKGDRDTACYMAYLTGVLTDRAERLGHSWRVWDHQRTERRKARQAC